MIHCPWFVIPWRIGTFEMLANVGGHVTMFTDESGFILPNSVLTMMTVLLCAFTTYFHS